MLMKQGIQPVERPVLMTATSKKHLLQRDALCGVCLARVFFKDKTLQIKAATDFAPRLREIFWRKRRILIMQERMFRGKTLECPKLPGMENEPRRIDQLFQKVANAQLPGWRAKETHSGVTLLGRFLRKYWIDELPQLWLLWVGEMKLVGIRPHAVASYLSYPKAHQEELAQVKPGLMNILYAFEASELSSWERVMAAHQKYLRDYAQSPLRANLTYAAKILWNILLRGARGK